MNNYKVGDKVLYNGEVHTVIKVPVDGLTWKDVGYLDKDYVVLDLHYQNAIHYTEIEPYYTPHERLLKIRKEEIEKLKELYDFGFKWIARNKNGFLCAFDSKPQKEVEIWVSNVSFTFFATDSNKHWELFKYIKWKDEKPYNIKHLIRNKYKILKSGSEKK